MVKVSVVGETETSPASPLERSMTTFVAGRADSVTVKSSVVDGSLTVVPGPDSVNEKPGASSSEVVTSMLWERPS